MLSDTVSTSLRCRSGLQVIGRDDIAPLPPAQPIFLLAKPPCLLLTFDLPAMPSEGAAANACYWEIFLVRTPAVKESISPSCSAPIYQGKVLRASLWPYRRSKDRSGHKQPPPPPNLRIVSRSIDRLSIPSALRVTWSHFTSACPRPALLHTLLPNSSPI